jgi:hypothetical protein
MKPIRFIDGIEAMTSGAEILSAVEALGDNVQARWWMSEIGAVNVVDPVLLDAACRREEPLGEGTMPGLVWNRLFASPGAKGDKIVKAIVAYVWYTHTLEIGDERKGLDPWRGLLRLACQRRVGTDLEPLVDLALQTPCQLSDGELRTILKNLKFADLTTADLQRLVRSRQLSEVEVIALCSHPNATLDVWYSAIKAKTFDIGDHRMSGWFLSSATLRQDPTLREAFLSHPKAGERVSLWIAPSETVPDLLALRAEALYRAGVGRKDKNELSLSSDAVHWLTQSPNAAVRQWAQLVLVPRMREPSAVASDDTVA